ncbi:thioredoxin [Chrysochromulina tobinii]|uniref:Thioredoxin n=1 Tax=Chrysochromulina tobinii TaxID=1460289 RepID=A0A0M0J8N2_9EUKA|nr:thioredoxin [Chrysochromulina tobinii]|eukprot:KOO22578.1 thioredoxin [Chrysochromulina sp. CCMP291]
MSKKKDEEEDIAKLIEDPAQFAKISGNDYEKDMLHVVEIFCTWCGPSDAVKSTYKRLAVELKGRKVKFYKMDAKLVPGFEKQALTSKPFFAIYKDGEIIEQVEGINTPLLEKFIGDTIPEGILEIEEEPAEGDEDD